MNDIIKYGIVGIGGMGANHANLFLQNKIKNGSLKAICDKNEEFGKNFPNIPFYKKLDNFFDKKLIDVAIIATPHRSHIDLGEQALKRGINIIIEKPLAVTSAQCRKFIEFSKNYDSKFGIMLNQRTNPQLL